jgi:putative glutamine amidotransferase
VGITVDVVEQPGVDGHPARGRAACQISYARAVAEAGGVPVHLAPIAELAPEYVRRCDAFVLTGGDDPRTEAFGVPTHAKATPMHPARQAFELALLDALRDRPPAPVLGVCLGMQLMALHAGGRLNQHLPDTLATADSHYRDAVHSIHRAESAAAPRLAGSAICDGEVTSHHRQAVENPGRLRVLAMAMDGVIEAVCDPARPFYLGVQWHPERTAFEPLGRRIFQRLVEAARG